MSEKTAVNSRFGGFQQTRKSTRPYRVETLLNKGNQQKPSERFEPEHSTQPQEDFESALASTAGEEFSKEANKVRTCMKSGCDNPADRAVIWADGRGAAFCCQDHVKHYQNELSDVVGVIPLDSNAAKGNQLSSLKSPVENLKPKGTASERFVQSRTPSKSKTAATSTVFKKEDIPEDMTNILGATRQGKLVKAVSERPEVHEATGTIKRFFREIRKKDRK
jgi:hypothetical protein